MSVKLSGGLDPYTVERRRTPSMGIDEKAISTLEQFVELCDNGLDELDVEEDEIKVGNVETRSYIAEDGNKSFFNSSSASQIQNQNQSSISNPANTNINNPSGIGEIKIGSSKKLATSIMQSNKARLCELFIDRTLVELKQLRPESFGGGGLGGKNVNKSLTSSAAPGSGSEVNKALIMANVPTTKKSEDIWVKRVAESGRRSFRTFRGQQLPSILTEDVDEGTVENKSATLGNKPLITVSMASSQNNNNNGQPSKGSFLDDSRTRHRSGGDEFGVSKQSVKSNTILDAFRPRSKSDVARLKKPNFMSSVKTAVQNSLMGGSSDSHSHGHHHHHSDKNVSSASSSASTSSSSHRPRSGSDSLRSPVSKVIDMFRNRSHSVNSDERKNRFKHASSSNSWTPAGRRASLHSHRPSDVSLDPASAAILFRDSRGLPVADPFLERILNLSLSVALDDDEGLYPIDQIRDFEDSESIHEVNRLLSLEGEENEILVKFFKFHKCYDLIPTSAKLVVFDTQLLVKKAFFALVYNGVRAAPLWSQSKSAEGEFVGMLTITDFIRVLHAMYFDSQGRMSELEEHRVETWRRRFLQDKQPLIHIDPDSSLYDAICCLVNNRIHRLPVIDNVGNVLHILTHKRILKFLFLYINEIPRPSFLNKALRDVKIGTFENVETAKMDTPIIMALQKFLDRRVSALPIVDEQNRLLDIYARFDVINLAAEKTYNNLDITLKQANEHRNEWFEGVHKTTLDETLFVIMEKIVKAEVHRLVVVDENDRVIGVISLSDILQYLVMRPELKEVSVADIQESMLKEEQEAAEKNQMNMNLDMEPERENPTIIEEEDEKT